MIAASNLLHHVLDQPWPGWRVEVFGLPVTLMSGAMISLILTGVALAVLVPWMARRVEYVPRGGQNFLESILVFVRETVARPALHEKTDEYLPFLTTIFVFVFALNLIGLVPLESISLILGVNQTYKIGGAPTAIPTVGAALASLAMLAILGNGLRRAAQRCRERHGWPMGTCWLVSPVLWFLSLSPPVPGMIGKVILVPMALLELVSAVAKCVALMVRLCANMIAGHMLLAVLMYLAILTIKPMFLPAPEASFHGIYVVVLCAAGSIALTLMELLVAGIQAFIFTIMTALFLGMYAEAAH
ncbi:MAG TPA: F0F1 ATP synthase subunit A [Phycisphaerae bacterium]|nr:F0F1 ATP synthase subunit A [Phycisphaerae bacterium]